MFEISEDNKKILYWVLFVAVVISVIIFVSGKLDNEEGMAPLDYGTYENNYPRGDCVRGSFKRSPCTVGNCPLGTTVTNKRYCGIVCAQEVDKEDRMRCHEECMDMMKDCQ